jgi:hypothetical protein
VVPWESRSSAMVISENGHFMKLEKVVMWASLPPTVVDLIASFDFGGGAGHGDNRSSCYVYLKRVRRQVRGLRHSGLRLKPGQRGPYRVEEEVGHRVPEQEGLMVVGPCYEMVHFADEWWMTGEIFSWGLD